MNDSLSYGGHSIELKVNELRSGRHRCTYFIDAIYCFQDASDASTFEDAHDGGIASAHASIDALNCLMQRFPTATQTDLHNAVGGSGVEGRDRVNRSASGSHGRDGAVGRCAVVAGRVRSLRESLSSSSTPLRRRPCVRLS